ncbi:hypothetical protein JB92DRAFT_3109017 [Gautieria morchelliformis]|nr:hypothetical protein JB92DRAFT_3109017 [Gautieria morchelliformis]
MSGITNNSRPKRKTTTTEKVIDPSNAPVPAFASHQAATSPAAAKLPSAPSPESIENALGGDVAKRLAADNSSSRANKRKTLDIVELTDSELAADEGENPSDSTGSTIRRSKGVTIPCIAKKRHKSDTDPIDVDADNVLADIEILKPGLEPRPSLT